MSDSGGKLFKVVNSSIGIAIGFAISGLLSIITRIVLGRFLEPSGYGMLSEGLAIMNFFVIFALLGTEKGAARFISHGKGRESNVVAALSVTVPLSIIVTLTLFLVSENIASLLGNPALSPLVQIFALNIPAYTVVATVIGGFRGEKKTKEKVLLSDVLLPALILISAAPLALVFRSPAMAAIGYLVSGWLTMAVSVLLYTWKRNLSLPSSDKIKDLIRFSSPLIVADYASFGLIWTNILLLGYLASSSAAGLYNAALPLSYALTFALTAVNYIFMPLTSSSHSKKQIEDIRELYHTVVRWLVTLTLPLVLILVLKPEFLITTLFGSSYSGAAFLLSLLALGRFLDVLFGPLGQILISTGQTREEAYSEAAGVILLTVVSLLLIPVYGVTGAGIGFLVGFGITNVLRLFFIRKQIELNPLNTDMVKPFAAAIIPVLILIPTFEGIVANIAIMLFSGLAYLVVLILLRPLKLEDIEVFQQVTESIGLNPKTTNRCVNILQRCQ